MTDIYKKITKGTGFETIDNTAKINFVKEAKENA
jgi:hypothetical protein|tara:strand:- start:782 stop:883 length:102 start_codon:yes stop_codon:yes gene_type:complete